VHARNQARNIYKSLGLMTSASEERLLVNDFHPVTSSIVDVGVFCLRNGGCLRVVDDEHVGAEEEEKNRTKRERERFHFSYRNPLSYADISQTFIYSRQSAGSMSTLQHRVKPVHKVPLLDMTDSTDDTTWTDPRSPTANVSR
jgi:hypothetical protein